VRKIGLKAPDSVNNRGQRPDCGNGDFGIVLAQTSAAHLLLSLPCALEMHEEDRNTMLDLRRLIVAVVIGCFLAAGAFAQKRGDRPPKPPNTVVVAPKGERPPPPSNNNNRGGGNDKRQGGGKKGKG
jgi:hypothetical protein